MSDKFKTIEEARAFRYNRWAGNPKGNDYLDGYCAEQVHEQGRGGMFYQCQRKVKAPALYCGQHKPGAAEARDAKMRARWKADEARSSRNRSIAALNNAADLLRKAGKKDAANECSALAKQLGAER